MWGYLTAKSNSRGVPTTASSPAASSPPIGTWKVSALSQEVVVSVSDHLDLRRLRSFWYETGLTKYWQVQRSVHQFSWPTMSQRTRSNAAQCGIIPDNAMQCKCNAMQCNAMWYNVMCTKCNVTTEAVQSWCILHACTEERLPKTAYRRMCQIWQQLAFMLQGVLEHA